MVHRLTKAQARRIVVRAQLLDATRPTNLVSLVERLTLLQVDPTAAIAPSADLVAWSRLGSSYRPADLRQALEQDRTLFEFNAVIRPTRELGLYQPAARSGRPTKRVASGCATTTASVATPPPSSTQSGTSLRVMYNPHYVEVLCAAGQSPKGE